MDTKFEERIAVLEYAVESLLRVVDNLMNAMSYVLKDKPPTDNHWEN